MGGFVGDSSGSGPAIDERLARRLKRKRVGIRGFGDYSTYLNQLAQCSESSDLGEYSDSEFTEGEDTKGDEYEEEDGVDPDYKLFLERSKEDGTSYVLTLPINKYKTLSIKYEADGSPDEEDEPPSRRKLRQVPDRRKTEAAKDLGNMLNKEKNCREKNMMNVAGKDIVDSLKTAGMMTRSNREKVSYNPFESSRNYNPLMGGDMQHHLGITHTGSYSEYREKLMDKLSKQYDHNEYETLMKLIKERKPKSARHIDLRGSAALKSHQTDKPSLSYLERYSDLDKKIDAVKRDRRKVLNLLRGSFFWLENVAHEDSFPPWLDPSCSEAMPEIPQRIKPCP